MDELIVWVGAVIDEEAEVTKVSDPWLQQIDQQQKQQTHTQQVCMYLHRIWPTHPVIFIQTTCRLRYRLHAVSRFWLYGEILWWRVCTVIMAIMLCGQGGTGDAVSSSLESDATGVPAFDMYTGACTLLRYMQPGETVMQTIRRLGKEQETSKTKSKQPRQTTKMKNVRTKTSSHSSTAPPPPSGSEVSSDGAVSGSTTFTVPGISSRSSSSSSSSSSPVSIVTECASGFLSRGVVDIYQDTYEKFAAYVQREAAKRGIPYQHHIRTSPPSNSNANDPSIVNAALLPSSTLPPSPSPPAGSLSLPDSSSDEVEYIYKWSSTDDDVQGPYTYQKMLEWCRAGFFDTSVVVRQVGDRQWKPIRAIWSSTTEHNTMKEKHSNENTTRKPHTHTTQHEREHAHSTYTNPNKKFKF